MSFNAELGSASAVSATGLTHYHKLAEPDAPLVFLVHGRAGNGKVMWAFRRCVPEGASIIAPQAPIVDPLGGFSWWEVIEKTKGEPAAMQAAAGLLGSFCERVIDFYNLKPRSIMAVGFSQGAGILSLLMQRAPRSPACQFSRVGLLAGFVIKQPIEPGFVPCPVLMCHGTRDETVPLDLARKGFEYLQGLGFEMSFAEDPVGHKIGPASVRALTAFLSRG